VYPKIILLFLVYVSEFLLLPRAKHHLFLKRRQLR